MPWYVGLAIHTGLAYLTQYVNKSKKLTPERKQAFNALMISVNEFVAELETGS